MRRLFLLAALAACDADSSPATRDAGPPDAYAGECPGDLVSCAVHDGGWNVWCVDGVVLEDDLTAYVYCAPGTDEELCRTGGEGEVREVATCAAGCVDEDVHWFETHDEWSAFDPEDLCAS